MDTCMLYLLYVVVSSDALNEKEWKITFKENKIQLKIYKYKTMFMTLTVDLVKIFERWN